VTKTLTNTNTTTNTSTSTNSHTQTSTSTYTQTQTNTSTSTATQTQTGTVTATGTGTSLGTTVNLQLGITVTPATPAPGSSGGPTISLVVQDATGAWAAIWQGVPGVSSVTNSGGNTTLVLSSSYISLPSVPLAPGQSPSMSINISPMNNPPKVNISAFITDPMVGNILQENGGSCTGSQIVIPPIQ
jgi:hypothetical protein